MTSTVQRGGPKWGPVSKFDRRPNEAQLTAPTSPPNVCRVGRFKCPVQGSFVDLPEHRLFEDMNLVNEKSVSRLVKDNGLRPHGELA